jgi:hypothetical protein
MASEERCSAPSSRQEAWREARNSLFCVLQLRSPADSCVVSLPLMVWWFGAQGLVDFLTTGVNHERCIEANQEPRLRNC